MERSDSTAASSFPSLHASANEFFFRRGWTDTGGEGSLLSTISDGDDLKMLYDLILFHSVFIIFR